jgi:hypothetical protein
MVMNGRWAGGEPEGRKRGRKYGTGAWDTPGATGWQK